jgi:hypothetical protein
MTVGVSARQEGVMKVNANPHRRSGSIEDAESLTATTVTLIVTA